MPSNRPIFVINEQNKENKVWLSVLLGPIIVVSLDLLQFILSKYYYLIEINKISIKLGSFILVFFVAKLIGYKIKLLLYLVSFLVFIIVYSVFWYFLSLILFILFSASL